MKHLLLLLGICTIMSACKKPLEKTQATTERITESVYASGVIKSRNQYQVYSTVNGLIQKILVKEGDIVAEGAPLFIIQNETSKLNVDNAQLSANFATDNLKSERLNDLLSSIETARSKMQSDSILLVRQRNLWAQQIGSKLEVEQRELSYTSSVNAYRGSIARYKDLQKQLSFSAAQSKKLLSISSTIAQDYTIRSQSAGKVYSLSKEVGEIVNTQSPIAIIGQANDFVIELQIDENDIVRLKPGQRVLLSLDSYKGQAFEAAVSKIDPIMNERSRTFTVEANFTKQPPILYPNLTAEANIIIQFKEQALTIPRNYLLNDSTVILENKEERRVKTGLKDYLKAEILSGLTANDIILKPGQ